MLADACDELQCRQVLFGESIREFHNLLSIRDCPLAELRHQRVFDAAAQNPAAQQERVHLVPVGQRLIDQDADKSIVAESIGHANHQTPDGFLALSRSSISFFERRMVVKLN